jgi:hypothetical protein
MNRFTSFAIAVALSILAGSASAQGARDIIGAWTLVSNTFEKDGKSTDAFGPNPKGTAFFDGNGRFAITIMRADLPKIAASSRDSATTDESQAVVKGSIAYFGTYAVNEADKAIVIQVEGATFANWTGTTQKRQFTFAGDQLRLINASPSASSGIAVITWQRAKKPAS